MLLKGVFLAALVLTSALGLVNLVFGWNGFVLVWNRALEAEQLNSTLEMSKLKGEKYFAEFVTKSLKQENHQLRQRIHHRPRDPVGQVLSRTLYGPFGTRPAETIRHQRYAGTDISVDTTRKWLVLGEKGRAHYHENLSPYLRALGFGNWEIMPVEVVRRGPFVLLQVYAMKDSLAHSLFTLTWNRETRAVIQRNVDLEGEGVFLHSASASHRYFVIDKGCCPGRRGFEVFDFRGASLWQGSYYGRLQWIGDTLPVWKVERYLGAGKPDHDCAGDFETKVFLRKVIFRAGIPSPTDSVQAFCSGPGE